jgi:hypothetical protein
MDLPGNQRHLLPIPGEGYQLIHYQKHPYDDEAPLVTHKIGVYVNFEQAQVAAQDLLDRTLSDYLRQGYYGRYWDEIDLSLRGLITCYVDIWVDGYQLKREFPLSEFLIWFVEVWDSTWVKTPMYLLHVRHTLTSYTNMLGGGGETFGRGTIVWY